LKFNFKKSWQWAILSIALVVIIGLLDYLLSPEIRFSITYLIPVAIAAWFVGRTFSLTVSFFITAMTMFIGFTTGRAYLNIIFHYWDAVIRLCIFVVFILLLDRLETALNTERSLSRIDFLTGAMNSRYFYELASMEIERCKRYGRICSVAYIDVDNLKTINDKFGHLKGDDTLRAIVGIIKKNIRKNDTVARLGGDEFIILFPETGYKAAVAAIKKIQKAVKRQTALLGFSTSLSIGILTCESCPSSIAKIIEKVDSLMYSIKNHKKDGIAYSIYKKEAKSSE
jgi:diguanylate cyclase (GGDEF)-like protein